MPTGHSVIVQVMLLVPGLQRECETARGRVSFTTSRMALQKSVARTNIMELAMDMNGTSDGHMMPNVQAEWYTLPSPLYSDTL